MRSRGRNRPRWFLKYQKDEVENDPALLGALRETMCCLQAGYGAAAFLLRWSFDDDIANLVAHGRNEQDVARI